MLLKVLLAGCSSFTRNQAWLLFSPLLANPTEWLNTLKQFVRKLPTSCLSMLDHFVRLALKGLTCSENFMINYDFKDDIL